MRSCGDQYRDVMMVGIRGEDNRSALPATTTLLCRALSTNNRLTGRKDDSNCSSARLEAAATGG